MGKVLVVGSINMDMTIFTERVPAMGETISGSAFLLSPGGKGANQAVAAARMGSETAMYGSVGDDVFGKELIRALCDAGVDASRIKSIADVSTGVASITVVGGDNQIILHDGANAKCGCDDVAEELIAKCDAVLLQLEIPLETVTDVIEIAADLGKKIFLTPAPARELPFALLKKVYCLLPNESETRVLLGRALKNDDDIIGALAEFREMGVREPVITLGSRGAACFIDERASILPANAVKAVDTTAAGDTFTGALATALIDGRKMEDAVAFAQSAAAICVTRKGAQNSIPSLDEVNAIFSSRATCRC